MISAITGLCMVCRARLLNNMVDRRHDGFTKNLEMTGVGYRAAMDGKTLVLNVGYSHPVRIVPAGRNRVRR